MSGYSNTTSLASLSEKYISNSLVPDNFDEDNGCTSIIYLSFVVSFMILIHSQYLHGVKYNSVQICTEISAMACILSNMALISCNRGECSRETYVYYVNLFVHCFCGSVVQAMDNYLVYTRYMLICHARNAEQSMLNKVLFVILLYGTLT